MAEALTFRVERLVRSRDDSWEDFVGPLDMILLLLSRDKIEIQDLSISHLVEQYLGMLSEWELMDMEIATEFTVMASHLVWLKTRMLLAVGDQRDEEVDSLLLALQKRQRGEQYNAVKWAADWLSLHTSGFDCLPNPPSPFEDRQYAYKHDITDLLSAYVTLTERLEMLNAPALQAFAGIVGHEPHPVSESLDKVLDRIGRDLRVPFALLLRECSDRSERIAVFLAVLELCKDCRLVPVDDKEGLVLCAA